MLVLGRSLRQVTNQKEKDVGTLVRRTSGSLRLGFWTVGVGVGVCVGVCVGVGVGVGVWVWVWVGKRATRRSYGFEAVPKLMVESGL